ncbi:hypothetical protein ACO0RG_002567 [Hanseniaspora osmophila]|uniref:Zinc-regulated transporter 2 n=1 Tax=Hanseniaspora osmophila TaxID=56408 RepID=A0A1E5RVB3_9ASCO|nr:Zinc-regulated transporter 2 [Hanseniaspora osmophila]
MNSTVTQIAQIIAKRDDDDDCPTQSEYNGMLGLRVLSIFMVLISSSIGAFLPILTQRYSKNGVFSGETTKKVLRVAFFIARNFGSGVIFATAFIHLLDSGYEALTSPCLGGAFQEYPMAYAICMLSIFVIYLMEIISRHYVDRYVSRNGGPSQPSHTHGNFDFLMKDNSEEDHHSHANDTSIGAVHIHDDAADVENATDAHYHNHNNMDDEKDLENINNTTNGIATSSESDAESSLYDDDMSQRDIMNQIFAIFVLEFGIIFHSVWVGLTLGVAGEEFKTLFVVIVFHQMFEGLGLSTRIAECKWPKNKKHYPYLMALAYGLTTPITIAIGVGVRTSLNMANMTLSIVSGVADSISGGILLYNSFELLFGAFNEYPGNLKMKLLSYFTTCWGVGLMALLGKWA